MARSLGPTATATWASGAPIACTARALLPDSLRLSVRHQSLMQLENLNGSSLASSRTASDPVHRFLSLLCSLVSLLPSLFPGQGTLKGKDFLYSGGWEKDLPHGYGEETTKLGKYKGKFIRGRKEGTGEFASTDGPFDQTPAGFHNSYALLSFSHHDLRR